jgi:hypothetical protein
VALFLVAGTIGILTGAALKTVAEEYQDLRWVPHEVMIAGLMVAGSCSFADGSV